MGWRVSFEWVQINAKIGGFTENFWNVAGTIDDVLGDAENLLGPLDQLHGRQTVIQNISIHDDAAQRNAENFPQDIVIKAPQGDGKDSDYFNTAALLQLKSVGVPPAKTYTVKQWVRSLQDASVDRGGRLMWTPDFTQAANQLYDQLISTPGSPSNWRLRVTDKNPPKRSITGITLQGVVTCPAHGFGDGSTVRVSGARGMTGVNSVWLIDLVDANTFHLRNSVGLGGALLSRAKPYARLQSPTWASITDAKFIRATSHKTGRPRGLLGGRRKKTP